VAPGWGPIGQGAPQGDRAEDGPEEDD